MKHSDYWRPIKTFLITGAYLGYIPRIPGTAASFSVVIGYALLVGIFPLAIARGLFTAGIVMATFLGFLLTEYAATVLFKTKDPQPMVLDEISGMGISLIPVIVLDPVAISYGRWSVYLMAAFVFFRCLDILKPGLIGRIDKSKMRYHIMLDDMVAGFFTALIMYVLIKL
ncbi:hypothetical protein COTS27_01588 [Spirochaetota bacterium]|nr:hypothetical protein COTS27_01588 [Spirochaetota bacterium]